MTAPREPAESPQVFAKRIGIQKKAKTSLGLNTSLSWDDCLDLAVIAYWEKRGDRERAA